MASLTTVETSYGSGSRPLGPMTWAALRAMDTSGLHAGDFVEVSDLGYSHWLWTGSVWRPRAPVLLDSGGTPLTVPNTTAETALVTVANPVSGMGLSGGLRIRTLWTHTNGANTKSMRQKLGAGVLFLLQATTAASSQVESITRNRAAAASQITNASSATIYGSTGAAVTTTAVDTAAAQDIVISGQKSVATDVLTLECREIWLLP